MHLIVPASSDLELIVPASSAQACLLLWLVIDGVLLSNHPSLRELRDRGLISVPPSVSSSCLHLFSTLRKWYGLGTASFEARALVEHVGVHRAGVDRVAVEVGPEEPASGGAGAHGGSGTTW